MRIELSAGVLRIAARPIGARSIAAIAIATALWTGAAAALETVAEPPREKETGWYLRAGFGWDFMRLKFDDRAAIGATSIRWDDWGRGVSLAVGYAFGPRFRGEMALHGGWRQAQPEDAQANSASARFTGIVPLVTTGVLRPHLLAGAYAGVVVFQGPGTPDLTYAMVGGDLGAGLRVRLSRHWGVQADYIHSLLDIEQEYRTSGGDEIDHRNVGRQGRAEALRVELAYDF